MSLEINIKLWERDDIVLLTCVSKKGVESYSSSKLSQVSLALIMRNEI